MGRKHYGSGLLYSFFIDWRSTRWIGIKPKPPLVVMPVGGASLIAQFSEPINRMLILALPYLLQAIQLLQHQQPFAFQYECRKVLCISKGLSKLDLQT
ncbi:MAG: hypothetical protein [Caudoviricetes sp.]|nr:MAG: hypothetical protein [Caudoviricetes sp.]